MSSFGPSAREMACGHWREILGAAGAEDAHLDGRHRPCPVCGGTDRFRFDDKEGRGTFFCGSCGAGDGFKLLMGLLGTASFLEAARFVEGYFGGINTPVERVVKARARDDSREHEKIALGLQTAWNRSRLPAGRDPLVRYLTETRGLTMAGLTNCLRLHPSMGYFDEVTGPDGHKQFLKRGTYSVMLAKVSGPTGRSVGLHRTYLTADGRKAPVEKPKKLMKGLGVTGGAIRLYRVTSDVVGVAEGIETAIAARMLYGLPVWATISATILEGFEPPPGIRRVVIFADNDLPDHRGRRAGQEAASKLKASLATQGISCEIALPLKPGTDFYDVWKEAARKDAERTRAA